MVKSLATIVSALAGFAASFAYGYVFAADLDPNAPANVADAPWSPQNRVVFECVVVMFSVTCSIGWRTYLLFGLKREAETVREELGCVATLLQVGGAVLLVISLAASALSGRDLQSNDFVTFGTAVGLIVWACLDSALQDAESDPLDLEEELHSEPHPQSSSWTDKAPLRLSGPAEELLTGVVLIDDGYGDWMSWRTCMLRECGEHIAVRLETYFDLATEIAANAPDDWHRLIELALDGSWPCDRP